MTILVSRAGHNKSSCFHILIFTHYIHFCYFFFSIKMIKCLNFHIFVILHGGYCPPCSCLHLAHNTAISLIIFSLGFIVSRIKSKLLEMAHKSFYKLSLSSLSGVVSITPPVAPAPLDLSPFHRPYHHFRHYHSCVLFCEVSTWCCLSTFSLCFLITLCSHLLWCAFHCFVIIYNTSSFPHLDLCRIGAMHLFCILRQEYDS